ncbi:hypothetical protein FBQ97_18460 [Acidobacteria bacterium ACD]|nr:hypothetical protein [Acidobacteria bacterium ACD]
METKRADQPNFTRREILAMRRALMDFAYQCAKADDEYAFREHLHELSLFEEDEAFQNALRAFEEIAKGYRERRRY